MKLKLISLLALLICRPLYSATDTSAIDAIFRQEQTHFFKVSRDAAGKWSSNHADSYYLSKISNGIPVFASGNGAFIADLAPDGSLSQTCVFGETTPRPSGMPGGWVTWTRTVGTPPNFKIEMEGKTIVPSTDWPCQTSFLLNALPMTEYQSDKLRVRVIACTPVSADGQIRPRGAILGILLGNVSSLPLKGSLSLTATRKLLIKGLVGHSDFNLAPGEETWIPLLLASEGDEATLTELGQREAVAWLQDTCSYWQRVTGSFSMPDDPFTAELFTRMNILALQSGVFDQKGQPAGVLYGVSPFKGIDNFKDSYYAILPAAQRDPTFLRPFIAWFAEYAARPIEPKYSRGISHSLGNSLNSVLLAGLYYQATADRKFFSDHSELVEKLRDILDEVLASRINKDGPCLFPSSYISDGKSIGDYHTGSNVCAYRAFNSMARILEEAVDDHSTAARYRKIAQQIKIDLDKHNIITGPFGPQYIEGTDVDGTVPVMIHDGEESDTTLMPFYGYCTPDSPAYLNDMRFAASPQNVAFNEESRGVVWENYGPNAKIRPQGRYCTAATFPSYVTALAGCVDTESLRGTNGYLTEIRRLTDVNGSWWWWPYPKTPKRGQVLRYNQECGWAEGVFAAMFPVNFLGINYDAPTQTLYFAPPKFTGDFLWEDFPVGFSHFTLGYQKGSVKFKNLTDHPVSFVLGHASAEVVPAGSEVEKTYP